MLPSHDAPKRRQRGSTLLGVAVALFLVSVALAFAVPAWQRARRAERVRATLADLQQFAAAFQACAHDEGDWPAGTAAPGAFPPGMEKALASTHWRDITPLGGRYVWLTDTAQRGERLRAAIAIVSISESRVSDDKRTLDALLRAAEAQHGPGQLRLGFRNQPVYVLEH